MQSRITKVETKVKLFPRQITALVWWLRFWWLAGARRWKHIRGIMLKWFSSATSAI